MQISGTGQTSQPWPLEGLGSNRALVDGTLAMGSVGEGYQAWMGWVAGLTSVSAVPSELDDALVLVADGTPVTPLMG